MKEGLLNDPVPDRGPGPERAARDTAAQPYATRKDAEARMNERTRELSREPAEPLTKRRTDALERERTESPSGEETDDSLDNGLEGRSEGSVRLESKAPSVGAGGDGAREEPPEDWLEPLEEDDDEEEDDGQSWELDLAPGERMTNGNGEVEEESLAGESERSGSVAGSERNSTHKGNKSGLLGRRRRRRRQSIVDEEWEDWPVLGEGWKRREVFRRSGFSVGKTDTYYMSPLGDRLRSKIELAKHLAGTIDLSTFDFKSGMFLDQATLRKMRKLKKFRRFPRPAAKRASSPDFSSSPLRPRTAQHRSSPSPQRPTGRPSTETTPPRPAPSNLSTPPRPVAAPPRSTPPHLATFPGPTPPPIGLSCTPHSPLHHGQRLRPVLKQEAGPPDFTQPELPAPGCSRCGGPVTGVEPWRKRQTSLCLKCRGKRKYDSPNIVFRKWLPCGQCRACLVTEDCGMCASCRNGQLNRDKCKPVRCRKRKCLCPIRKKTAKERLAEKETKKVVKLEEQYMTSEVNKVKPCTDDKESDSEFIVCIDGEDEEEEEEDKSEDEVPSVFPMAKRDVSVFKNVSPRLRAPSVARRGFRRRVGRPCGCCAGCLRSADCGDCDACEDRLGPTARGKARRRCRLRRCQRQAGSVQYSLHEGWMGLGSPRPHYSSSCFWEGQNKGRALWDDLEFSEDEDEEDVAGAGGPGDDKLQREADKKDAGVWTSQNCLKAGSWRTDVVKADRPSAGVPDTSHSQGAGAVHAGGREGKAGWAPVDGVELHGGLDTEGCSGEQREAEVAPMISGIFSLAEEAQVGEGAAVPCEPELLNLLEALRKMSLPSHWVPLLAEGPGLQLLQCSKRSTMADTALFIDSSFYYQISVQGQPLQLTHTLYREHPRRLPTVPHVVALLLDLERYAVCRGCPAPPSSGSRQPLVPTRAAICAFLVLKTEEHCEHCRDGAQGP